jgi:hypothetical protein
MNTPAPGSMIPLPWGGFTDFTGKPCGDCLVVLRFEVVRVWIHRTWTLVDPPCWRSNISIQCPTCMELLPTLESMRNKETRQHLGWYDLRTGSFQLRPDAMTMPKPANVRGDITDG